MFAILDVNNNKNFLAMMTIAITFAMLDKLLQVTHTRASLGHVHVVGGINEEVHQTSNPKP